MVKNADFEKGKCGVILDAANNRSIAWRIARTCNV